MECKCCDRKTIRNEEEKKKLNSRINRIIGQLEGIKRMVDDDRYCADILIQLSAVDKAIKSLASIILDNHMHSCLIEHIEKGDYSIIDEISNLIRRFQ